LVAKLPRLGFVRDDACGGHPDRRPELVHEIKTSCSSLARSVDHRHRLVTTGLSVPASRV
jgi:hypothetical protein